jgi:hypothetical protein
MGYNWVHTTRLVVFGVVSVLALIVMALSAHWISVTESNFNSYYRYAALALATALMTFSVPAMLAIDYLRRGALTSLIIFELSWLGFLWIMWLATGSYAADVFGSASCDINFLPDWWSTGCHETQAIIAFSFLNWIALSGYLVSLLIVSVLAANRGAPVWMTTVKDANFAPVNMNFNASGAMGTPEGKAPISPAMQQQPFQQQEYPQQGYPQQPPAQGYPPQAVQV